MIFTFEGNEQFPVADMPPRRQPRFADGRHFTHPSHPNGFSSILVTVPIDVPDDFTQLAPNLDIRRGPAFALEVTLEAEPFDPVTLFGLVTIRSAGGGARSGEG